MKVLVVGLGSMGKRRIRNLKEIGIKDIFGYDIREDRRKQASELYSISVEDNFDKILNKHPDVMIISTSPDAHKKYAMSAIKNKINFFTEVNTMNPKDMEEIINEMKKDRVIGIPSSNLMFHPSIVKIKQFLDNKNIGKILTFNFHSGSYLPDWHPWEKLSEYYVYDKETGGGRDQIMWELSWIYWLLGKPTTVTSFTKKLGDFEAKIFDVYNLMIEFKSGTIGNVLVDVIQQPPGRTCEIIGERGTIKWDYENKFVEYFSTDNNEWRKFPESDDYKGYEKENKKPGFAIKDEGVNETYIDEMKNLFSIIKGEKNPEFTFEDEKIILELMYAAEKSSETKIHEKLNV